MDKETIIRLAREAGAADITSHGWTSWVGTQSTDFLERFAALIHDHLTYSSVHSCHPGCTKPACVAMREAIEAEREECAKVCEHYTDSGGVEYDDYTGHGYRIAVAIRSRT